MICKLALVGLFLQKNKNMEMFMENPILWLIAIAVLLGVFVSLIYVLYRWIFDIPRIVLLLEGIYQQQGGKLDELYKEEPETPRVPGSGS